jgi:hypothetical protein
MNTLEILRAFKNNKTFVGVFPRNKLPVIKKYPSCLIINTDKASESGTHWVAVYLENVTGEYFDSFGRVPMYREIFDFMERNCPGGWRYNSFAFQDENSTVCGQHSIFFLRMKLQGHSYCDILNYLSRSNPILNDSLVASYL